ncbi:C-type lectin domain family 4 member F-like [Homarus americanus]|uniref:C-type lectin domain family 4 member F-like n=1 Tax=Homarus americanus TaxID=6706 RepID=UPI001C492186|nr:C-type lectin domain family 4 member F-like [Homarus americanus]
MKKANQDLRIISRTFKYKAKKRLLQPYKYHCGTWDEMNNLCHEAGGQLAKVDTDNFMYYLIQYIIENGLDHHHYWIGASDSEVEDDYRWLDGSKVKRGTPFWGYYNDEQQPTSGTDLNCVYMSHTNFFYFYNYDCEGSFPAICEQVN